MNDTIISGTATDQAMARAALARRVSQDDIGPAEFETDLARAAGKCDRCGKQADKRHLHGYGSGAQYLCTDCAFQPMWAD